jgi:hypothetical protein
MAIDLLLAPIISSKIPTPISQAALSTAAENQNIPRETHLPAFPPVINNSQYEH